MLRVRWCEEGHVCRPDLEGFGDALLFVAVVLEVHLSLHVRLGHDAVVVLICRTVVRDLHPPARPPVSALM